MKKNSQNNLKQLKEKIKAFISKYITKKENNVVKSAKIHHYFSLLNDINISSHSFFPLFLNTYKELFGEKLITKAIRFKKGDPLVRCIFGIHLELATESVLYTALNNTVTSEEHINNLVYNTKIQEIPYETKGKIKTKQQTVVGNVYSDTRSSDNKINLDLYFSYFEPGNENYSSEFMFELYKTIYKDSPIHLSYIKTSNKLKPIFKEEWLKLYPNNPLILDVRFRVNGHFLRGFGGLKKVKD